MTRFRWLRYVVLFFRGKITGDEFGKYADERAETYKREMKNEIHNND